MRYFVGIGLPETHREVLSTLQLGLHETSWVDLENFHITLTFLGDRGNQEINEIVDLLATINMPAFSLALRSVNRFGSDSRTRVIWAGVNDDPCLFSLQAKVLSTLRAADIEIESKKFVPHVTLARNSKANRDELTSWLAGNAGFRTDTFDVDTFGLYSSHKTSRGNFYRLGAEFSLSTLIA
jgi:2'-5' RNA ligase